MRWIKKFEGYLDRFYYKDPDTSGLNDVINMSEKVSERLFRIYGSRMGERDKWRFSINPSFLDDLENFWGIDITVFRKDLNRKYDVIVNELVDEWFTLELFSFETKNDGNQRYLPEESGFWSCDGFDGLVKLIDDLGIFRKV